MASHPSACGNMNAGLVVARKRSRMAEKGTHGAYSHARVASVGRYSARAKAGVTISRGATTIGASMRRSRCSCARGRTWLLTFAWSDPYPRLRAPSFGPGRTPPSPPHARRGLERVREFGERNTLELLSTPEWPLVHVSMNLVHGPCRGHQPLPACGERLASRFSGEPGEGSSQRARCMESPLTRPPSRRRRRSAVDLSPRAGRGWRPLHCCAPNSPRFALVSRFRSSHHSAARSFANFGIEGH